MDESIVIPIVFFGFLGTVIVLPIWFKHRAKVAQLELMRHAIDKGQALDPEVLQRLGEVEVKREPEDRARRSLGSGVILTALALGLAGASFFTGDYDASGQSSNGMLTAAVIVGALGLGFILLAIVDYATKRKDAI